MYARVVWLVFARRGVSRFCDAAPSARLSYLLLDKNEMSVVFSYIVPVTADSCSHDALGCGSWIEERLVPFIREIARLLSARVMFVLFWS